MKTKKYMVYFDEVNDHQRTIRLNNGMTPTVFTVEKVKSMMKKTSKPMINALNHMLVWAQENNEWNFINKFNVFMTYMRLNLYGTDFKNKVYDLVRSQDGIKYDELGAKKKILMDVLDNLDDDVLLGIIKYTEQNIHINTNSSKEHETTLSDEDVFVLVCIITVFKMINIGINMLGQVKLEYYAYEPAIKLISRFQHLMSKYYLEINYDSDKYDKVTAHDFQNTIIKFLYTSIKNDLKRNNHMAVFYNYGRDLNQLTESLLMTVLTTIYKIAPIRYLNEAANETYVMGEDYREFKLVYKTVVKYIKSTIKHMTTNTSNEMMNNIVNAHIPSDGDDSSNYKYELFLEKRDVADINDRKYHIKLLERYVNDFFIRHKLTMDIIPIKSALSDYFVILALNQISQDVATLKLLDGSLYAKLGICISHMLYKKYPHLSLALTMDTLVPTNIILEHHLDEISKLRHYKINKERTIKNIRSIVEVEYRFKNKDFIVPIVNEFIAFLAANEKEEMGLFDTYIYDYEDDTNELKR